MCFQYTPIFKPVDGDVKISYLVADGLICKIGEKK